MSRYDWSKARPDTIAITTNANGQVIQHTKKPVKIKEDFIWASFSSYNYNHACPDWEDSLEERPVWKPKHFEHVFILDVCELCGYRQIEFNELSANDRLSLRRGYIFRTREEAIIKVKELGWE